MGHILIRTVQLERNSIAKHICTIYTVEKVVTYVDGNRFILVDIYFMEVFVLLFRTLMITQRYIRGPCLIPSPHLQNRRKFHKIRVVLRFVIITSPHSKRYLEVEFVKVNFIHGGAGVRNINLS